MRVFSPIYDWMLEASRHRYAPGYLATLSFAEATVFPVPPDVMLAPMVLADRTRAWWLALLTTVASVLGGLAGYLIGALAIELVHPWIVSAGYEAAYDQAVEYFLRYGVWFVIVAGFTPIPFKVITIAAGSLGMPVFGFILGSIVGRGARFFLVATVIYLGGRRAAENLRRYVDFIGWTMIGLILLGLLIWWLLF